MKQATLFLFILISHLVFAQPQNRQIFYVGTFTSEGGSGILRCGLNTETGDIELLDTYKSIDNPSFLKISPDKKYMYTATRPPKDIDPGGGYVNAYEIEKNGALKFIVKQSSNGADPCHVDVSGDGKWVAAANYGGGTVSLYPVDSHGGLLPATSVVINQGSGADKTRQAAPHAHSIKFSPFSGNVFSADLGTDQLDIFTIENGKLVQGDQRFVKMEAGAGPRHFEFHPSGKLIFVINELNSTITTVQQVNGKWERGESVSTLPEGFEGKSYCADIHLSADGLYLYGSNRGHNSIAVFEINGNRLKMKTIVPVEGNWPRNFALSPDGRFLLAANQRSGNITVFRIDKKTGIPVFTGHELKTASPVCIEFLIQ
jgi:6-phosphogluconolactonase